jgi:hypothetical protein
LKRVPRFPLEQPAFLIVDLALGAYPHVAPQP